MKLLKDQYADICQRYIKQFCEKHGFDDEFHNIGDDWGTINIADYYFYMGDIRRDVDEDAPIGLIIEWYDQALEHHENESIPNINYASYIMGARFEPAKVANMSNHKDKAFAKYIVRNSKSF